MPKSDYIEHRLRKYTVTTTNPFRPFTPAHDEIHYADGRIRPLADLISGVEATIDPSGILVGGIWVPARG